LLSLAKKASASDEACPDENSKFVGTNGLTNNPATCPRVKSWKVRDYLATITTEVFARNESDETRFSNFHCKRVLQNGEAVDCPWLRCSASKIEYVAAANVLALDVQMHFTQHLQTREEEF